MAVVSVPDIITHLCSKYQITYDPDKPNLTVDGSSKNQTKALLKFFKTTIRDFLTSKGDVATYELFLESTNWQEDLVAQLKVATTFTFDADGFPYSLYIDMHSDNVKDITKKTIVTDSSTNFPSKLTNAATLFVQQNAAFMQLIQDAPLAELIFDKNAPVIEKVRGVESRGGRSLSYYRINTFKRGDWWYATSNTATELEPLVERFMTTVIPDEVQRDYLYGLLHESLTKCTTIAIYLRAKKGVGKTLILNPMIASLEHPEYVKPLSSEIFSSKNGAFLRNTAWLQGDEIVPETKQASKKLLALQNPQQLVIRELHKNPTKLQDVQFNFCFAFNHDRNWTPDEDSRKDFVPDLIEQEINEIFTPEELNRLIEGFRISEDDPFGLKLNFSSFIKNYHSKYFTNIGNERPPVTENFREACIKGFPPRKDFLYHHCLNIRQGLRGREEIHLSKLNDAFQASPYSKRGRVESGDVKLDSPIDVERFLDAMREHLLLDFGHITYEPDTLHVHKLDSLEVAEEDDLEHF